MTNIPANNSPHDPIKGHLNVDRLLECLQLSQGISDEFCVHNPTNVANDRQLALSLFNIN